MSCCAVCGIIFYTDIIEKVIILVSNYKLWKSHIDKKMKSSQLKDAAGISFNVFAKMGKKNLYQWKAYIKFMQL